MTTLTCYRCNNPIPSIVIVKKHKTWEMLKVFYSNPRLTLRVDLCDECKKELEEWLKGKKQHDDRADALAALESYPEALKLAEVTERRFVDE